MFKVNMDSIGYSDKNNSMSSQKRKGNMITKYLLGIAIITLSSQSLLAMEENNEDGFNRPTAKVKSAPPQHEESYDAHLLNADIQNDNKLPNVANSQYQELENRDFFDSPTQEPGGSKKDFRRNYKEELNKEESQQNRSLRAQCDHEEKKLQINNSHQKEMCILQNEHALKMATVNNEWYKMMVVPILEGCVKLGVTAGTILIPQYLGKPDNDASNKNSSGKN